MKHKNTVLVIDDEKDTRESLIDLLEMEGYNLISAKDGRQGVVQALNNHPDLIICDVMMPVMGGFEVVEALRNSSETADIPFIFLTARSEKADLRKGMNLGADDFLTKPYEVKELLSVINMRLKKIEQQRKKHLELSKQIKEKLEEQKQKIDQYIFVNSHQVRAPVARIMGLINVLVMEYEKTQKEQDLHIIEKIYNTSLELDQMIRDLGKTLTKGE